MKGVVVPEQEGQMWTKKRKGEDGRLVGLVRSPRRSRCPELMDGYLGVWGLPFLVLVLVLVSSHREAGCMVCYLYAWRPSCREPASAGNIGRYAVKWYQCRASSESQTGGLSSQDKLEGGGVLDSTERVRPGERPNEGVRARQQEQEAREGNHQLAREGMAG